jgi:hypothetical protein
MHTALAEFILHKKGTPQFGTIKQSIAREGTGLQLD